MDPEDRKILEETYAMVQDTHRMMRNLRREQWWSWGIRAIFWVAVILIPFYFLEPYLTDLPSLNQLQQVIQTYRTGNLPNQ